MIRLLMNALWWVRMQLLKLLVGRDCIIANAKLVGGVEIAPEQRMLCVRVYVRERRPDEPQVAMTIPVQ